MNSIISPNQLKPKRNLSNDAATLPYTDTHYHWLKKNGEHTKQLINDEKQNTKYK